MKFLIFLLAFAGNKIIIFLSILIKIFQSVHSYANEADILPHVVGGANTLWGQFSASVIIQTPNDFCGGSVIDDLHVRFLGNFLLLYNFFLIRFSQPQVASSIQDLKLFIPNGLALLLVIFSLILHRDVE
jgi:hypothetical protein